MKKVRVLIADDEALVRHALRIFVDMEADLAVVGEARNGIEAVNQVGALRPDVVLMDLQMPIRSGIEAITEIVATYPDTRVLAVTTFSSESHVIPALRAGASGYLVKDTRPDQIVAAIREVHSGGSVISPHITSGLIASLKDGSVSERQRVAERNSSLTSRELSIVELLAQGMSNYEIAKELKIAEPTVKANLSRVMRKWDARDRVQVLIRAVQSSLVKLQ